MSESSNSTSTSTWQQDNRRTIGNGGISAEGSIVDVSTTDLGAIKEAFGFGNNALKANANLASDALGFGANALKTAGNSLTQAYDFGAQALESNRTAYANATKVMADSTDNAIAASLQSSKWASQTASTAMDQIMGALGLSLDNSQRSFAKAYDALDNSAGMVATAYADAKGRGALTDKMIMLALVAMAAVALYGGRK